MERSNFFGLSRPVWLLGWVSLATDAASEAIYPLLPFFLTQILGAGVVSLGVIEGAAEAANSALKVLAGRLSDRAASKRWLVFTGYALSSAVRPLMAVAQTWTHVLTVRLIDRTGKGIRGAPRDAMLASLATPATRGKVFGFHRAMDHLGAVVGPVVASVFLFYRPGEYRTLFALAIIPGTVAVALILLIKEGKREDTPRAPADGSQVVSGANHITSEIPIGTEPIPGRLKAFLVVLTLFTLGNSTDAFLLLQLTDVAGSVRIVPLMWAALHVVKATMSVVGGNWSDRIGRRAVIAIGWTVYAFVYAGFAMSTTLPALLTWFLVYGLYFGLTEGVEKALVADLAPVSRRGYAFGIYNAVQGVGGLAASVIFGLMWNAIGSVAAFGTGAALAITSAALLFVAVPSTDRAAVR